jgi:acetyl-CoA acetyltransferase
MKTWIIEGLRTPIGLAGGGLSDLTPDELMSTLVEQMQVRFQELAFEVDAFWIAQILQSAPFAQQSTHAFNLPGFNLKRRCHIQADTLSAFEAMAIAQASILSEQCHCVFVGAQESVSQWLGEALSQTSEWPQHSRNDHSSLLKHLIGERSGQSQFESLESTRRSLKLKREHIDQLIFDMTERAIQAQDQDLWFDHLCPIVTEGGWVIEADESLCEPVTPARLIASEPYEAQGSITPLNTARLGDGASLLWMCSDAFLNRTGHMPLASIEDIRFHPSSKALMQWLTDYIQHARNTFQSLPYLEISTEFGIEIIQIVRQLDLKLDQVNRLGGTLALGNPLGCRGINDLLSAIITLNEEGMNEALILGHDSLNCWSSMVVRLPN